jgi:hypothetical protein
LSCGTERWGVKLRRSLVCRSDVGNDTIDQIAKAEIVPARAESQKL